MAGMCIVCGTVSENLITCKICGNLICQLCQFEGICKNCMRGRTFENPIHKR